MNLREKLDNNQQLQLIQEDVGDLSSLLAMYPEEALEKLIKNKDKLHKIAKLFDNGLTNITASVILMRCCPTTCPYRLTCPLLKAGIEPEGSYCPIEKKITNELEITLMQALDIDPQDTVEMELLYDFIDAKLLDLRTSGMLAEGSLIQEITKDGRNGSVISKDIAPEFSIKMDLKALKARLLNEFMATRLSKKRYGIQGVNTMEDIIKSAMAG